jgi:hypothetical protein
LSRLGELRKTSLRELSHPQTVRPVCGKGRDEEAWRELAAGRWAATLLPLRLQRQRFSRYRVGAYRCKLGQAL